jgi:hypothetical protein
MQRSKYVPSERSQLSERAITMTRIFLIFLFVLMCRDLFAANPDWQNVFLSQRIRAAVVWETDDGNLLCGAQEKGQGVSISVSLSCFSEASGGEKRVSSLALHPGTVDMRVVPTDGAPLFVTAGTGSGFAFECFVYTHGQVKKVWEGGSFLPFETFSTDDIASNVVIALAQPEWALIRGEKVKVAGRAQLFLWTGNMLKSLGESAWAERFSVARARTENSRAAK